MAKISVIVPVYNVEKYLKKCLDSLICQSFKDIEILCVNDASTDSSAHIISSYAKEDDRVKLINLSKNMGVGFAKNTALKIIESDYVAFVDGDDYIEYDYLENLLNTAEKYNSDMVFTCNIDIVRDNFKKPYYHNRIAKWQKECKSNYPEGVSDFTVSTFEKENTHEYPLSILFNKIIRKSFIEKNKLQINSFKISEDSDFYYQALSHKPIIAYNHNAKYYYIQRKTSITHSVEKTNKEEIYKDALSVFENIFNAFKNNDIEKLNDSNYWNFKSLLFVFDKYNGDKNKKEVFYSLMHSKMKELDVTTDKSKNAFIYSEIEAIKKYENYIDYFNTIEKMKKRIYSIAWFIPSLELREKFKQKSLNKIYSKVHING